MRSSSPSLFLASQNLSQKPACTLWTPFFTLSTHTNPPTARAVEDKADGKLLRTLLQSKVPPIGEYPARLVASLSNLGAAGGGDGGRRKLSQADMFLIPPAPTTEPTPMMPGQPLTGRKLSQATLTAPVGIAPVVEPTFGGKRKLAQADMFLAPSPELTPMLPEQPLTGRKLSQAMMAVPEESYLAPGVEVEQEPTFGMGQQGGDL